MQEDTHRQYTIRLDEQEQRMLTELLEYYNMVSFNNVMRASLHRMYFEMRQAQLTQQEIEGRR